MSFPEERLGRSFHLCFSMVEQNIWTLAFLWSMSLARISERLFQLFHLLLVMSCKYFEFLPNLEKPSIKGSFIYKILDHCRFSYTVPTHKFSLNLQHLVADVLALSLL